MRRKEYQIALDQKLVEELRKTVNSKINFSLNKHFIKGKKEQPAWSLICSIMDRIDDTIAYLNTLKLNTEKYSRSAFDFFEFINQSAVIIDSVNMLAKIYDVSMEQENLSIDIFSDKGKDGRGTDKQYFEYLRSLCAVHPIETSHHSTYQDSDFECSPYVVWDIGIWNKGDIYVCVYTSKYDEYGNDIKHIHIKMNEVFSYVDYRYNLLKKIIKAINQQHDNITQAFIDRPIKQQNEFGNYIEYLENLKQEMIERVGDDNDYILEFIISLFRLKLSDSKNQNNYQKYCNAFKYAVTFEHNALQNMSYDGFNYNGIVTTEKDVGTSLIHELVSVHSGSAEVRQYHYNLEKIGYLNYESGYENKLCAYQMIEEARPFFERYITFENAMGDFEHYALVQIALYFDCLDNPCLLNKNIPNDLKYRNKL